MSKYVCYECGRTLASGESPCSWCKSTKEAPPEAREEVVERVARAIWESYWPDRDVSWVREQWEANAVFHGDRVQRVPRILAEIAVPIAFDDGRKYDQEQASVFVTLTFPELLEAYEALKAENAAQREEETKWAKGHAGACRRAESAEARVRELEALKDLGQVVAEFDKLKAECAGLRARTMDLERENERLLLLRFTRTFERDESRARVAELEQQLTWRKGMTNIETLQLELEATALAHIREHEAREKAEARIAKLSAEVGRLRGVIRDIRLEACALSDDDDATGGIRAEILAAANAIWHD